jgi:hypothetical protein
MPLRSPIGLRNGVVALVAEQGDILHSIAPNTLDTLNHALARWLHIG